VKFYFRLIQSDETCHGHKAKLIFSLGFYSQRLSAQASADPSRSVLPLLSSNAHNMTRSALSTTAYSRGRRIAPSVFFFEMAPANIACPPSQSFHEIIAIRIHFTSLKGFKAK
jgi:hypothetical protein